MACEAAFPVDEEAASRGGRALGLLCAKVCVSHGHGGVYEHCDRANTLLADGVRTASLATASRDMLRHRPTSFTVHQCRVVSASAWLRRESVGIGHAGIDNTAHMHYVWL